jgi:hypothetical protein
MGHLRGDIVSLDLHDPGQWYSIRYYDDTAIRLTERELIILLSQYVLRKQCEWQDVYGNDEDVKSGGYLIREIKDIEWLIEQLEERQQATEEEEKNGN